MKAPRKQIAPRKAGPKKAASFALYWCTTPDGDEDWFVVAPSARTARSFHEDAEGYDRGDAHAERVMVLPRALRVANGWRNGPDAKISRHAAWPTDELLLACGGEIAEQPLDELREQMAVVTKDVRFGQRVFRAGDVVTNMDRLRGRKEARLSVFQGAKKSD